MNATLNPQPTTLNPQPVSYGGRTFRADAHGYLRDSSLHHSNGHEIMLHRQVWKDNFGPIPNRAQIRFKDGNKLNCAPGNLLCGTQPQPSTNDPQLASDTEARIADNMGWVASQAQLWARRLNNPDLIDDLLQQGRLAIVQAHARFDPAFGFTFLSYAKHWVRNYMRRWIYDHGRTIRVPPKKFFTDAVPVIALQDVVATNGRHFEDILAAEVPDGAQALLARENAAILAELIAALPEKRRAVIERRFFQGQKLHEIANALNLTAERIRQIEHRALAELRQAWDRKHQLAA